MTSEAATVRCCITGECVAAKPGKNAPKLPRGWKRFEGRVYSASAWRDSYAIRAVVVPVMPWTEPGSGPQSKVMREAWKNVNEVLADAWAKSTQAANWAVKTLLTNDVTRSPDMTKCPKMPPIYLYGHEGHPSWEGWAANASSLLQAVERKYRAARYDLVWLGKARLPDHRYPYPFPVRHDTWSLELEDGGRMVWDGRLPAGRMRLALRIGPGYRRQRAMLKHLIDHPDLGAEAALYRRDGRVMLKLVGWFPRREAKGANGVLSVRTDSDSLLIALDSEGQRLWVLNADRIRREQVKAARAMQRWREDRKAETRRPKRLARRSIEEMRLATRKHRNRINSWIDEAAANVVGFARRRNLATIRYDDSDRGFCDQLPYYRLSQLIEEKCRRDGIAFEATKAEEKTTPMETVQ